MPQKGDALLFNLPTYSKDEVASQQIAGVCRALPNDTVWIDYNKQQILLSYKSDTQPLVIPKKNGRVDISSYNGRFYAYILHHYEKRNAKVNQYNDFYVDGKVVRSVLITHDYYWIETLPNTFILIPHEALVGKIYPMKWL